MANGKLEFELKLRAEFSDLTATQKELQKNIATAKQAGQDFSKFAQELDKVEARMRGLQEAAKASGVAIAEGGAALGQEATALDKSSHAAGKAEHSHRQLHILFHAIGEQLQGLGQFLNFYISRLAGFVAVGIYLISSAGEGIKKMMESISETTQFSRLTEVFERQKRALEDSATAAKKYGRELAQLASEQDIATEAGDKNVKMLAVKKSAQEQVDNAHRDAERAHIEATVTDPAAKAKKLEEVEDSYAVKKLARDKSEAQAEITVKEAALDGELAATEEYEAKLEQARAKASKLGTIQRLDETASADKENLARTEELRDKKQKRLDELQDKKFGWFARSTPEQAEMNYLKGQIEELDDLAQKVRAKISGTARVYPIKRQQISEAQDEVSDYEGKLKGSTGRANRIQRELPELKESTDIKLKAEEQAAGFDKQKRADDAKKAAIKEESKQESPRSDKDGTQLEKMGFAMSGIGPIGGAPDAGGIKGSEQGWSGASLDKGGVKGSGMSDGPGGGSEARQTAQNTFRIAQLLEKQMKDDAKDNDSGGEMAHLPI